MDKKDPESRGFKHQSGKGGPNLRDFRFRVPSRPLNPVQYGVVERISDRVLATTSENICSQENDQLLHRTRSEFLPAEEVLPSKEEDDQMVEMKTLCIDKRAVKMPSNDEHRFLKFCGLGLKNWQCPIEYSQGDFRSAILSIYPKLLPAIGFTVWMLTENMKILERIPDEKTTPKKLLEFQQAHCTDILIIVPSADLFLMEEKREYLRQIDSSQRSGGTSASDCLVCGTTETPGNVSDFYRIKTDQIPLWTKNQTIEEKLEEILGIDFEQKSILSEKMCPKCFKYISWINKMEEQLKRSRGLLSNAFHATNSKLIRPNISLKRNIRPRLSTSPSSEACLRLSSSPTFDNRLRLSTSPLLTTSPRLNNKPRLITGSKRERARHSVIAKATCVSEEIAQSSSPDLERCFLSNHQPLSQYTSHDEPSPIRKPSPSIKPSSRSMLYLPSYSGSISTIPPNTNNYTSGYESSCSITDFSTRSPQPHRKTTIQDHQADSCFESDSNCQGNESPRLYISEPSPVDDFDEDEKPFITEKMFLDQNAKGKKNADYCWEVINSQDLKSDQSKGTLRKRHLSHDQGVDPDEDIEVEIHQTMKRTMSNPKL